MHQSKSFLSKKTSKANLRDNRKDNSPGRRISCKDLGKGDCEGWLWIKKISIFRNKFVRRWCVLKNKCFYYYIHNESDKAEGYLHVQDFNVAPTKSFRNDNYSFKIHNEEISFTFGCDSQGDFTKWLNKLQISANNIEISDCHGMLGGFSPAYIRSASSTMKSDNTICNQSDDSSWKQCKRVISRYSESEESDEESDKTSEETFNADNITTLKSSTKGLKVRLSAAEPAESFSRTTEELNELTMGAIRRIVEIERKLREKTQMISKIDECLNFPTSEKIRDFYDDNTHWLTESS